ncbi:TdeIII family type II restriction endonuclease [Glutamicibacter mysorens]
MDNVVREKVRALFEDCVERTLQRLTGEDTHRPFHAALLSQEVVFWSRFERSFSTSFGQAVVEKISKIICDGTGATSSVCQKDSHVTLTTVQWEEIEAITRDSRGGNTSYKPDWEKDLERVLIAGKYGSPDTRRVRSDLFWEKDGVENYMSIKTVKPNLDQTAEAKRDLLKLAAENPDRNVYFGLYYNPYGDAREAYKFNPPLRLFNFETDRPILIGKDYWDTLGGTGTYDALLEIASDVGKTTRKRITGYGSENLVVDPETAADLIHPGDNHNASLDGESLRNR